MTRYSFAFLLFLIFLFLVSGAARSQVSGRVIKVKDGDTIVILDDNNIQHTIRVADIDCPEWKQPFSNKAKQFTSVEVFGKHVAVKVKSIDRYGRTVGYVLYDNKNLSEELLRHGFAWHYLRYSNSEKLQDLEGAAKKDSLGLWSVPNQTPPWEWRRANY